MTPGPMVVARTALITGATAGIGAAFANRLASEGYALVLVARNQERLEQSASKIGGRYDVAVETIGADLSTTGGMAVVEGRLRAIDVPIDLLINNAGFGLSGSFLEVPVDAHDKMLSVNGRAVLRLSHAALSAMVLRGSGGVINVSSVAGFIPGFRKGGTYAASKAFVTALTESVAVSLEQTGVTISAVCPGFVHTEFHQRAGINMERLPGWLWLDADEVAALALRDHRAGRTICVPKVTYRAMLLVIRLAPRGLLRAMVALVGSKLG